MKIVVTGASGYVGSAIVAALCRAGHQVTGIVRSSESGPIVRRLGASAAVGDIARPETIDAVVERSDALIHAAIADTPSAGAIDRRFVEHALEVLGRTDGLRRFVYTSGIWVLGDTGEQVADESTTTERSAAIVAWRPEVEALVARASALGVRGWTVRPGIVYGGSGGITGMLFDSLEREGALRVVGDDDNRWPLVHRDDLGDLYRRIVEQGPEPRVLHAVDGSHFRVGEIAAALAGGARVVRTPLSEARASMGPLADALALDQRVSNALATRVLGWSPTHRSIVSEAEGLRRTWREGRSARQADQGTVVTISPSMST